ncbi:MAG: SMI1/KNR4 family protein [Planctomycetes bacterium]|nr:SMI1/KNR4 family protein [Planctomycetota bacterium]
MIWDDDPTSRLTRPALTPDTIRDWEQKYGLRLPARLSEELALRNGGYLACARFRVDGRIYEIPQLFGIAPEAKFSCLAPVVTWHAEDFEEAGSAAVGDPRLVVPLCGDGHSYYCLDWNDSPPDEPSVCALEIECGLSKVRVADTFTELLARQYPGEQRPAFRLGEREGVAWTHRLAVGAIRADGHTRLGRCFIGAREGKLLIDHEEIWGGHGPTWHRLEFPRGAIDLLGDIRIDRMNGRWSPRLYQFTLRPLATLSLCARLEARNWLWLNETGAPAQIQIADSRRERLVEARRLIEER